MSNLYFALTEEFNAEGVIALLASARRWFSIGSPS
jgi:hypothetical protein